jgi:signal peptidase I
MTTQSRQKDDQAEPVKKKESIGEVIRTVVYAVLIALVLRTVAYEPFVIPSGSMLPTLLVGDYVFVSKFSYGYSRYSIPLGLPLFSGRIFESQVARGDVAVFKLPTDKKTDYIKRIVGLPGDRLQMLNGQLFINSKAVTRKFIREVSVRQYSGNYTRAKLYRETLPNGVTYLTLDQNDSVIDTTPVYEVPKGHYFAMGDNRDDSTDSRFLGHVGYIPAQNMVGRADFFFFSVNAKAEFWQVWRWPVAVRFARIFKGPGYYQDDLKVVD